MPTRAEGAGRQAEGGSETGSSFRLPPSAFDLPSAARRAARGDRTATRKAASSSGSRTKATPTRISTRNCLRHEVLPLHRAALPGVPRHAGARGARISRKPARLLDELARRRRRGRAARRTLAIAALRAALAGPRPQPAALFPREPGLSRCPSAARLDEALRQALTRAPTRSVAVDLGACELRQLEARAPRRAPHARGAASAAMPRRWRGERELGLPELAACSSWRRARGAGLSLARLSGRPVTIRPRAGGERLQPDARRPRRTLKNLLQEARVRHGSASGCRSSSAGGISRGSPAIGVDCAYQAQPGERSVRPAWRPARGRGRLGASLVRRFRADALNSARLQFSALRSALFQSLTDGILAAVRFRSTPQ